MRYLPRRCRGSQVADHRQNARAADPGNGRTKQNPSDPLPCTCVAPGGVTADAAGAATVPSDTIIAVAAITFAVLVDMVDLD